MADAQAETKSERNVSELGLRKHVKNISRHEKRKKTQKDLFDPLAFFGFPLLLGS